MSAEEQKILEKYREVSDFGELHVIKQNGKAYEYRVINKERAVNNE